MTSYRRAVLFLFCSVIASALSASISLADKELECYSQEKVYHEKSDKCYKLLTKGPCESGEWLVLENVKKRDASVMIKPVCAKERCEEGQYYWPGEKACVESKDVGRLCGESKDEVLLNNVFGEGECSCARDPPRVRLNGDKRSPCYQLYTRGPCNHGEVIVLPPEERRKAACIQDPCHRESKLRRRNGSLSRDGILAPSENGTCYELGTQGPCPADLIFKVQSDTKLPACTSHLNHIFQTLKRCPADENGDCQMQVAKIKGNKYLKELQYYLKNN